MDLEQNEKIQTYLDTVCSQIKWRDMHAQIRLELISHIGDLVEEYEKNSIPGEDPINKALSQMGNARELGKDLHHIHKPRIEWSILALAVFFLGFGLFILYSLEVNSLIFTESSSLFAKSLIYSLAGMLITVGMYFFNYRRLKSMSWPLYVGALVLWLCVLWQGSSINGKPYLNLGFITIDFAEIALFFLTVAIAGIFTDRNWQQPNYLFKTSGLLLFPIILALMSSSLTTAFLYALIFLIIMRTSGAKIKDIGITIIFPLTLAILSVVTYPHRIARLFAFFNPYQDPQGAGYAVIQSIEAIRSAGFWGQGFNFPIGILPQLHTDFIFTYIVYSLGWITGLAVVVLATALLVRIFRVSRLVKDRYGRLLVSGLVGLLLVQFYWNILMTVGLAPLAAFSLPLVSYGGSHLIIQMTTLGLVLSIYRRKDVAATTTVNHT
ncbi:Rod shape-determining protein RodA [Sporotomaculum syntrophicum]|uniref:Rod shape-determining protein RodA n=1 Tax=Sporotomaculum syntrophicum TaxID=182264 RepID=A0A9D2WQ54_9FIRM|nr:FtsW/RodA/SpoVE family cell cycle protein [Sporotomaculum syntrophicum]KAF1085530.1 Rod shape-determining protein RodA [Sporotomaculum syntrophicum]